MAIFEKKSDGTTNMYYVHTDHLGSLNVLTDANGAIAQETSYDAWGNRRDPATLQNYDTAPTGLITDRGFTGHEHLEAFKLINMNGRVYDPTLGRFLSPDNFVQDGGFTQSYNRYSYCMNNPLSFTDPSGMIMVEQQQPYNIDLPIYGHMSTGYSCSWLDGSDSFSSFGGFGGGGGSSIFPMMGVAGGPMNDLEYDIQLGQNIASQIGSMSYLNGVRAGVERGNYNGSGTETKNVRAAVYTGNNDENFRGFIFTDNSSWYTEDGLTNVSQHQNFTYINSLLGMNVVQKKSNWCAFAIGEMIYKKLNGLTSGDQTQMANDYYKKHKLPENSNIPASVKDYISGYFASKSNFFTNSWENLVSAVKQDLPVLVGLKGADVGHAVYIYGVYSSAGSNFVMYWDPGVGQGRRQMDATNFINKTFFIYVVKDAY